jgi:hypothetical protein
MASFSFLTDRLPPVVARTEVARLLGGVVSAKTLANCDSLGIGPEGRIKLGRKVVYDTAKLLAWLENRAE